MVATTLEEAFNALDHRQPVKPEQVDELFVLRPHSPVQNIRAQLRLSDRPQKLLFVGHRGAGKSSEMSYLSTLLTDSFRAVFIPLYDIFKSPNVSHTELVFAVTLRLLQEATTEELVRRGVVTETWETLLEEIYQPLRELLFGAEPIPADRQASITVKLRVLVAELEAKVGTESYTRNQVREKFEGRIAELLHQIGHLSQLLEQKIERRLLLIIEDLDKFDKKYIEPLFLGHARTLTTLYPSVIYSFPVDMRYTNEFRAIQQSFDDDHILPNVALQHRDGSADEEGIETMRQILLRRVAPELFAGDVIAQAIAVSGGHAKTLIQVMRLAVANAVVDGETQVQVQHLRRARQKLRDDYVVLLKRDQIDLLRRLRDDANKDLLDTTDAKQALLFNGSLLEYADSRGPWAGVNPVVLELLERVEDDG